jgi:hypothetical protein
LKIAHKYTANRDKKINKFSNRKHGQIGNGGNDPMDTIMDLYKWITWGIMRIYSLQITSHTNNNHEIATNTRSKITLSSA